MINLKTVIGKTEKNYQNIYEKISAYKFVKFYRLYFQKYNSIRTIARFIMERYLKLHLFFSHRIFHRGNVRKHNIINLKNYLSKHHMEATTIFDAEKIKTPPPICNSIKSEIVLTPPGHDYDFPDIYLAELSEIDIEGRSNIIFKDNFAVVHDLFDVDRDLTSEELHGRYRLDVNKLELFRTANKLPDHTFAKAAIFCDACSPNWAHWLTEVLPRIVAFCTLKEYRDVPLIIDDNLHPNILETLSVFVGEDRKIFAIPPHGWCRVRDAYVVSVCGYTPFDRRVPTLKPSNHGMFNSSVLSLMQSKALSFCDQNPPSETPKKIFLRRNSNYRKLENSAEIEAVLSEYGYVPVDPEKLDFLQQVALFSQADCIIGPTGAAFANMVFCKPDTKITILIARSNVVPYWYWQNMACAGGKTVEYVLSEEMYQNEVHSAFSVNIAELIVGNI